MSDWWSPPAEKPAGRRAGSDRKPLRFWQPFNDWWRAQYEETGKRPTSDDIAKWYDADSDTAWGQEKPSLPDTRTHAKCLRSVESVRDYFRDYRAKKKQEQSDQDDRSDDTDMMRHSQADNASQQTARHSEAGGTPCSKARHIEDLLPIAPDSDSSGRGSGSGGRGRGRRGRGRGAAAAKVGRGQGSHAMEHIPYQNLGAFSSYQPVPTGHQYGNEQLAEVHPGALVAGDDSALYQQYPQYMLMQQGAHQDLSNQQAYVQMQRQHAQPDALGYQQPYMQMHKFDQPVAVSTQQQSVHPGAVVQAAPPAMPQREGTTAAVPVGQITAPEQQAPAVVSIPAQQPIVQQQQAPAIVSTAVDPAAQQQPPATAEAALQQPTQQQQPPATHADALPGVPGQRPQPAAAAAAGPEMQPGQQPPQQHAGYGLTPSPPSLQLPAAVGAAGATAPSAAPNDSSTQPPRTNTHTVQLPRGSITGIPNLFSPTLGSLDFGRLSSLGFDRAFSLDMAGLQGLPPWIADLGALETTITANLNPFNPSLDVAGGVAAGPGQQDQSRPHPAADQPRTGATVVPVVKLEPDVQYAAHAAAQHQPQYRPLHFQGDQARPEYTGAQLQGRMLPPPALGAQHTWQQQQHQMQLQHAQQQAQDYMHAAALNVKQEPTSHNAAFASSMTGHLQTQHYMQAYSGLPGPLATAGVYNDVFSRHPDINCNAAVPAHPSVQHAVGHFGHRAASAAPVVTSSRYQMAAPPPLALPSAAGSSGLVPRPRRSFQNNGMVAQGYGHPSQHASHNAAGILTELEAIKGPAMQGLMDVHTANQQHRIGVSALLDLGPFGPAARRTSQALDPLTTPHHRLSLYALGSDAIDILGLESLDLDTFLGTGSGHGDNGNTDLIAPIAPGSRTAVKIQGEPVGQWTEGNPVIAGAFCSLPTGMAQAPVPLLGPRQQHQAAPQGQHQLPAKLEPGAALPQGMSNIPVRTSITGETAWAVATGRPVSAADSSGVPTTPGQKRKLGLVLDLGTTIKRQRVSGLLMELDTPRVRNLAGPLLSPRPGGGLPTGRLPWASTPGRPLSTRHKAVLDLRSPATQQQEQQQALVQQQQRPMGDEQAAVDAADTSNDPAPKVPSIPAGEVNQQQRLAPAVPKQLRVLNLADDLMPPAGAVDPVPHTAAPATTGPVASIPAPAAFPADAAAPGSVMAGNQPVVPPASSQPMLIATLSGSGGSLGTSVSGDGAVAQVTVGRMGGKGFLPAMHEIEKMI